MIPWPIGVIAALFAVVATASAGMAMRGGPGAALALLWCIASVATIVGLASLKDWGRRLGVWLAMALTVSTLLGGLAAFAGAPPQPMKCLAATGLSAVYMTVARYLTRPRVKAWFGETVAHPTARDSQASAR